MSGHHRLRSSIGYELAESEDSNGMKVRETYQTHQMQPPITLLRSLARIEDSLVLMERPLLDRNINTDDILPDDTSGTDIQVSVRSSPG